MNVWQLQRKLEELEREIEYWKKAHLKLQEQFIRHVDKGGKNE